MHRYCLACCDNMSVSNADQYGGMHCFWSVSFPPHNDYIKDYLHLLRVLQCMSFKIAILVYKAHHDLVPWYFTYLIVPSTSITQRGMRFSSKLSLIVPRHCTKFAEHAFAVAGLSIWNGLPHNARGASTLTEFCKKNLKDIYSISLFCICEVPSLSFSQLGG